MLYIPSFFTKKPSKTSYCVLWAVAFVLRALVFIWFVKPGGYYRQPDTLDYHNSAASLVLGIGMYRPDNREPIFWRTPGYPLFLAPCYALYGAHGLQLFDFDANKKAHDVAIWLQIIISSCIPLIIFALAYGITQSLPIAWIIALISLFHIGFVLASTYLLTEGIALLLFYLFLLFFYKFLLASDQRVGWFNSKITSIIFAALMLALYTWIRPMGECVSGATALIILLFGYNRLLKRSMYALLFFLVFAASISPWYIRNYRLTGDYFFCPTIGTYFNCFCVPKILRRILNKPIEECHKMALQAAGFASYKKKSALDGTGLYVSPAVCKEVSFPIVRAYPWYFLQDWFSETVKTTFDLYASQLVAIVQGTFWYDPIEEFLPEKIALCLYKQSMPVSMRIIAWIELFYALFIWFGISFGIWLFVIKYWFGAQYYKQEMYRFYLFWMSAGILMASVIAPTGGFGYARLRLPIEPLMLILAFSAWHWLVIAKQKKHTSLSAQ